MDGPPPDARAHSPHGQGLGAVRTAAVHRRVTRSPEPQPHRQAPGSVLAPVWPGAGDRGAEVRLASLGFSCSVFNADCLQPTCQPAASTPHVLLSLILTHPMNFVPSIIPIFQMKKPASPVHHIMQLMSGRAGFQPRHLLHPSALPSLLPLSSGLCPHRPTETFT